MLPGLVPNGVPRELKGTSIPFEYNDIEKLKRIVEENKGEIAAIMMEPVRSSMPNNNFLHEVRNLATKIEVPLIFDEITSGFRMNCGGVHMYLNVEPDIAVFGKALGNGYPISAVVGKKHIMESAQDSFISSTFWTERVGFTAALATLNKFKQDKVHEKLIESGQRINSGWKKLALKYNLPIKINGIPPLTNLKFDNNDSLLTQTMYAKFMIDQNYLVGSSVYTTYAYTKNIIDNFLKATDKSFKKIACAIKNDDIDPDIINSKIETGFKRLT